MGVQSKFWRCSGEKMAPEISLDAWNCLGLGKTQADRETKLDYCRGIGSDVLCLNELWNHHEEAEDFVVSDKDAKDRAAGVGLLLSARILPHVMDAGSEGARIAWVRIRGPTCNLFIVGVYLPHSRRKAKPHARDVLERLEKFLRGRLGRHDCLIILGDFNAQLPRGFPGLTGKWTLSIQGDKGNAPLVMSFMRRHGLMATNTLFQPPRGESVATWQRPSRNALRLAELGGYPARTANRFRPKQLDYVLCITRWCSSV